MWKNSQGTDNNNSNNNDNDTRQKSKYSLYEERVETINLILREYNKLAQKKYKARCDWVGKVIH